MEQLQLIYSDDTPLISRTGPPYAQNTAKEAVKTMVASTKISVEGKYEDEPEL